MLTWDNVMTNFSDKELDKRIHAFLTKKMQKSPELDVAHRDNQTVSMPNMSLRNMHLTR